MDIFYTKEFDISFYELNRNGFIKESKLFQCLQEIAALDAERLGFGYTFMTSNNWAWFVLKYHLKIHKWYPEMFKLKIKTWSRGSSRLTFLRDFEIYSENDELLASVSSAWALVDVEKKRILQPDKTLPLPKNLEIMALETNFPKIPDIQREDAQRTVVVQFDDIDINQHVNNSNYITWALSTLEDDFRLLYLASEIEVNYKKEVCAKESLVSSVEHDKDNLLSIHSLKNALNHEEICTLRVKWAKKD